MKIDMAMIRAQSEKTCASLGYFVPTTLPLSEQAQPRDEAGILGRTLALNCVIAYSYGFDHRRALNWLDREALNNYLEKNELDALQNRSQIPVYKGLVEALYAFVWSVNLLQCLDWTALCPNSLVKLFPDIKKDESSAAFRGKARLRNTEDLLQACDTAYCIHWSMRDAELNGRAMKGQLNMPAIRARRHALEWIVSDLSWNEITLDT